MLSRFRWAVGLDSSSRKETIPSNKVLARCLDHRALCTQYPRTLGLSYQADEYEIVQRVGQTKEQGI